MTDTSPALVTADLNVVAHTPLPSPAEVKRAIPSSDRARSTVLGARAAIADILDRTDNRLLLVVGPCSVHDLKAAHEYADRLAGLAARVADTMLVVMRVYFEKPRTTVGWKGFINDPALDGSFQIGRGLHEARRLLLDIAELGVPAGTEALDPINPQYLDDLISWTAIGARTTESQTHREMASGLSTAVGFKNGTEGDVQVAIHAIQSAQRPHRFLGINADGRCSVVETRGNRYGHIVLRGGTRPNYDSVSIALCERQLTAAGIAPNIMVDCSHGNSGKDPSFQPLVLRDCVNQIREGNRSIIGLMLESNLEFGNQPLTDRKEQLRYGVSITDGCIDWQTTERVLLEAHERLAGFRGRR